MAHDTRHAFTADHAQLVWSQIKSDLAAAPHATGPFLAWVESVIVPLLKSFGDHINVTVLTNVILTSLAAGGGIQGVLVAILANLGPIFNVTAASSHHYTEYSQALAASKHEAPREVVDAARAFLEAEQIRLHESHADPAPAPAPKKPATPVEKK